ncbi:MAG: hypothetical protein Q4F41_10660 [Eubacteriales bacterium]|nr:hypothetical protein [Eubacteriales bacterium]
MSNEKIMYDPAQDADFQDPYVDAEEWRERSLPDGRTVSFCYIHGGFAKKGVKFLFCMPEKAAFRGRFYQYLSPFPGPDEELASLSRKGEDDKIAFCLEHGAYYVESNMGSKAMFGPKPEPQLVWKSSAAVAEYSRIKAMELYGCGRPYGYVYGGSGGGYKTMACIENTRAWDGAVPFVIGSPVSLPNTITMHVQGQRCLRKAFGKIVDALDVGGSGNPYEDLTEDEAFMLRELTNMGYPPITWFLEAEGKIDDGSLPVLLPDVKAADPAYFRDFWEVPGYLGADETSSAVRDRLQFHGIVKSVHLPGEPLPKEETDSRNGVDDAWKKLLADGNGAWIELEELPAGEDLYLKGTTITCETGAAAGKQLLLGEMKRNPGTPGGYLTIGMCYGLDDLPGVLGKIQKGDQVFLDNSDYIAVQSYYRHQVPADLAFHAWDQFRDADGKPTLPQREKVMGYGYNGTGTIQDGNIQGKVIVIQALMDESTCPWCGDWYRRKVKAAKGSEEDFRIYYMDHCIHGDESGIESTMLVNYQGALKQALLDLGDWVEHGKLPLETSHYQVNGGQISMTGSAGERKGIQPVPVLKANGETCVRVRVGEPVVFTAEAEVPDNAGEITLMDFAFGDQEPLSGTETFRIKGTFETFQKNGRNGAVSTVTHTYEQLGVYFAAVKVQSQRTGCASDVYTQVKNLARARVIAEP